MCVGVCVYVQEGVRLCVCVGVCVCVCTGGCASVCVCRCVCVGVCRAGRVGPWVINGSGFGSPLQGAAMVPLPTLTHRLVSAFQRIVPLNYCKAERSVCVCVCGVCVC